MIPKEKVVSFDLYDTLIKRRVSNPHRVFDIIGEKVFKNYGIIIKDFKRIRINAEKLARKHADGKEVTLDMIYQNVQGVDTDIIIQMKQLELDTEIEICELNVEVAKTFYRLLQEEYTIIITSDMYLPIDTISIILNKCKVEGFYKLYLSSEIGYTKRTGKLYDYIVNDLALDKKNLLHIGDNPISDYLVPKLKGINAFCLRDY